MLAAYCSSLLFSALLHYHSYYPHHPHHPHPKNLPPRLLHRGYMPINLSGLTLRAISLYFGAFQNMLPFEGWATTAAHLQKECKNFFISFGMRFEYWSTFQVNTALISFLRLSHSWWIYATFIPAMSPLVFILFYFSLKFLHISNSSRLDEGFQIFCGDAKILNSFNKRIAGKIEIPSLSQGNFRKPKFSA